MAVPATVTIDHVNSFTDTGKEFRLDCVLNLNNGQNNETNSISTIFQRTEVKVGSFPKSGFAIGTDGTMLVLNAANKTMNHKSPITFANTKAAATFFFNKY